MKTERRILAIAAVTLALGIAVAYYNTCSLGYDNANIISFNSEELKIFDFVIKYSELEELKEKISKYIPDDFITI
ncbi:MAG: hypothetical protein ACI4IG_08465 [Eubacterium sp.]